MYKFVFYLASSYVKCSTQKLGIRIRQHVHNYAMDLFDSRLLPLQRNAIRTTHQKPFDLPTSAISKNLLINDNFARWYNGYCFTLIWRTKTTLNLCVKQPFLAQTQANSQHSEGSALKATFHTNMTQLRGEAIKSRLNVAKTPIVSLIVFVYLHVSLSILQKL